MTIIEGLRVPALAPAAGMLLLAALLGADEPAPKTRGPRPPFLPSPEDVVEKMLELAEVKMTDVVVDLGCGDGRIVVTAAKKYRCKAIGYDLNKECIRLALEKAKENGVQDLVRIEYEDIFHVDLSKADVVCLYLLPSFNEKLVPQLEKMKPGSRIVSHAFNMKGIVPNKVITIKSKEDEQERKLYLWTAPLKRISDADTMLGPPRVRMLFMRHSDIRLTMQTYDDSRLYELESAVKALDKLGLR